MTSTLVTPLDLSARIAKGEVTVLDVRTPGEYQAASIADSAHLPLDQLPAHSPRIAGELAQPVALVCGSGKRAQKAAELLAKDGARDLLVLDGGITAWQAAGHPVEQGQGKWALERQVRLVAGGLVLGGVLASLRFPKARFLSGAVGGGLTFAAISNTCAMGSALLKLPYNKTPDADTAAAVSKLTARR